MLSFNFKNVCIESFAFHRPPYEVSSAEIEDKLAELYNRLKVPFGTLEKLSGVKTRHFFDRDDRPSKISTVAGEKALDDIGFDREHLKVLFNCSVTRDFFEPSTATLVHKNLGLPEDTMAMDITNACIGFSNGLITLGNMIESGAIKAGLLVSGENLSRITEATFRRLLENDEVSRDELLKLMPTFTLGSGAVAMVLCHESIATKGHRLLGSVSRSATDFNDLCVGNGDFHFCQEEDLNPLMETDSPKLIAEAAKLGGRIWQEATETLGWSRDDIDRIFCHQVGKQLGKAFYKTMGLPIEKEYVIYPKYGNLVSAALPAALIAGVEDDCVNAGDNILLTAFGSGLNGIFTGIRW